MQLEIVSTLITSVIGGLLVAIVNHLFTRKRTEAETRKLEAEVEKLRIEAEKSKAEIDKLKAETEKIRSETKHELSEAKYYDSPLANENLIYESKKGISGADIHANFSDYDIQKGVIVIQNENWSSYELQTYIYDGKLRSYIPKDETIAGFRRFRVSCEVKVIDASYNVRAFLWETSEPDDASIDDRDVNVTSSEWKEIHFYFKAPPDKNYTVQIGTERTSGQGSLQIRNLVVAERIDSQKSPA
jgi:hypothetical protein